MSRSEDHARFLEYSHMMVGGIVLVMFAVLCISYGNHVMLSYRDSVLELSTGTMVLFHLRWAMLVLPLGYIWAIRVLKKRDFGREKIFLTTYAFTALSALLTAGFVAVMWLPMRADLA